MTTERPINFNAEMVRAILEGRKTVTRRPVKERWNSDRIVQFWDYMHEGFLQVENRVVTCPFGVPGDRLWVRETWNAYPVFEVDSGVFEAGYPYRKIPVEKPVNACVVYDADGYDGPWRPLTHMPRWASRITLEVTGVRVERVQCITEEGARAEGFDSRDAFLDFWDSIYASKGLGCDANPLVWVVEFKRVEGEK